MPLNLFLFFIDVFGWAHYDAVAFNVDATIKPAARYGKFRDRQLSLAQERIIADPGQEPDSISSAFGGDFQAE